MQFGMALDQLSNDFAYPQEFTLADLFHLAYGDYTTNVLGIDLLTNGPPHVQEWWKDISSRPSWVEIREKNKKLLSH